MSRKKVRDELKARGFRLVSQNRHKKFKDAQGRTISISTSPSDVNAELAQMRDIECISSAPVARNIQPIGPSTAALARREKRKAGAGSGGNSNRKVASYIKSDAPSITEEQREADRLESECNKLKQRMEASFLGFQHQCNVALTYALVLVTTIGARKEAAKLLREIRLRSDFDYQRYLSHRQHIHLRLKGEARKYAGNLAIDLDDAMPWVLGLKADANIQSDREQTEQRKCGMELALQHFLNFVSFPKWLPGRRLTPNPNVEMRRLMQFVPPPAELRRT